jgi:hypothetical protein
MMGSQVIPKLQYPTPNLDGKKKDLIIHIVDKHEREPKYFFNYLKQIEFPKSTLGFNLIKEVVIESKKLDFIDLFSLINIAEIKDENSRSELLIDFVEKKGPIFNKKKIADMARSLGIQQESTLQNLQRLPTQKVSFEVARSSSDTKELEQQKMLALINETISFLDFAMIVEMGIKNGYPQFQGDDNKIGLIMAFFTKPRGKETITESQFSNFITNIEISDPQKKDRSFKEFHTKNRIGKILSSKEEIKTSQRLEPVIEIQSIPVSISNQTVIEIRSTTVSKFFEFSKMVTPQSNHEDQSIFQEIETPQPQSTQGRLIATSATSITSDFFFAPPNPNFNPIQRRESTQQPEIGNSSNQNSFQGEQLTSSSKKCCTIL